VWPGRLPIARPFGVARSSMCGQVARWPGGPVVRVWPSPSTYGEVVQVRPGRSGAARSFGFGQVRLRVDKSLRCGQVWRGINMYGRVWPGRLRVARWPGRPGVAGGAAPVSRGPVAGERRHSSRRRPPRATRPQLRECSAHANSTSVPAPSSQPPWHPSSTHPGTPLRRSCESVVATGSLVSRPPGWPTDAGPRFSCHSVTHRLIHRQISPWSPLFALPDCTNANRPSANDVRLTAGQRHKRCASRGSGMRGGWL
jgi:hypothetical protein